MSKFKLKIAELIVNNWWKIIFIILSVGLVIAGFSFSVGPMSCEKDEIKIREEKK